MNSKKRLSKLSRNKGQRDSLMRNMVTSLVLYEHMKTTKAKSKMVTKNFDKVIKMAKQDNKQKAKKDLTQFFYDDNAVAKTLEVLAKRFKDEDSGLVHVYKIGRRKGDNAEMVKLLVKGYEYKDIGKGMTKKAKKQDNAKEEVKAKEKKAPDVEDKPAAPKQDKSSKSQVKDAAPTNRAKSRSGI